MNRQQASWIGHRQTRLVLTVALLLGAWTLSATAWAQSSRNTSRNTRSSSGGGSWTQSNSAYSTGSLGGTSSMSGSRSGSGGSTSSSSMSSQLEQAASNTQFSRSSRGAENFVGADSSDSRNILGYENSTQSSSSSRMGRNSRSTTRSAYSNTNRSANRNFNSYGNSGSYGYGTQNNRSRYGQSSVSVQPTLSLGFDYAGPVVPNLTTKLTTRLKTSPVATATLPVQVQVLDGTATLTGTVASDHERALAEQLLALEPGVRRVDNQLSVAPPDPK